LDKHKNSKQFLVCYCYNLLVVCLSQFLLLFNFVLAVQLHHSNYLHWKQQVEPVVKAHKLHLLLLIWLSLLIFTLKMTTNLDY